MRRPKRRLHRKKIMKGMFFYHNGRMLWKYHAYQSNRNTNSIMLCYDVDGSESYFKDWASAKKYIRSLPQKEDLWPLTDKEFLDETN